MKMRFVALLASLACVPGAVAVVAPVAPPAPWFSSSSPLNQPLSATAAIDPNSASMIQSLTYAVNSRTNGFVIASKHWSVPVYHANAATATYNVPFTEPLAPGYTEIDGVPIPSNAAPDPEADGHMAVINDANGCFYEFWGADHSTGVWKTRWANRGLISGTGIQAGGYSTRASGFVNFAGLIRPEELQAGTINHALVFSYPYTKAGGPVLPATKSDGRTTTAPAGRPIPEGARLRLPASLNLSTLGLNSWQLTIAKALQSYGMYLTDTGGATTLFAQNPQSYSSPPYPWGDLDYSYLPNSLASRLQVLKLGAQYTPTLRVESSSCAVMK